MFYPSKSNVQSFTARRENRSYLFPLSPVYQRVGRSVLITLMMVLVMVTLAVPTPIAQAATFTVTSNADSGVGSLRQAIIDANGAAGGDTITFDPSLSGQTITLGSALPFLTSDLTIDGSSLAAHVKISGNNAVQVFAINLVNLTLTHLDIINGNASDGGGILNNSTLTVNNSTFSGNKADLGGGGGIVNLGGTVKVNNSTFSGNSATDSGGGIFNNGTLTVNNSTFSGNSATNWGGGIFNNGTLTVNNSTFSGNKASNNGGGIFNNLGTVTLKNSILANSTTGGDCRLGGSGTATGNNNLIEDAANACGLSNGVNNNIIGVDPLLGALANNGGGTQTLALLAGSLAINAGDSTTCMPTDQRGYARVGVCDMGAFEYGAEPGYSSSPSAGSTINVGSATVGSPVSRNLQVSETGSMTLSVTSPTLSGANVADFSVTPATLSIADAGAAQNLTITCTPTAVGSRSATLTVNHNAPGTPATYTLNCTGTKSVTTSTGSGTAIFNGVSSGALSGVVPVTIGQAATDCGSLPTGYTFPHGFFDFNVAGVTAGGTVDVSLTLPSALPSTAQYFLCKTNGTWAIIPSTVNGNQMVVHFTDGSATGDGDGLANSLITDQGGPGVPAAVGGVAEMISVPTASPGLGYLAGLAGVVMLLGAGWLGLRRGYSE